jgi:hypothetical protein
MNTLRDACRRCTWLCLLLLLLPAVAWPAGEAGKVLAVRGAVSAANAAGELRELKRGDDVFAGDTLNTGANSFVRVKFSDGGSIYLREASRFAIDGYAFNEEGKEDTGQFNLIRGGFRAVTGAIGKEDKRAYAVQTPVTTIGIRGTDYQVRLCLGDCIDLQLQGIEPPADGLYVGTNEGIVLIGGVEIPAGTYSYTTPDGRTVRLEVAPDVLRLEVLPDPSDESGDAGAEGGGADFEIPPSEARVLTLECPI